MATAVLNFRLVPPLKQVADHDNNDNILFLDI